MEKVLNFLNQLQQNNDKGWFDEHKSEYKEAQEIFNSFTQNLIIGISAFDPSIKNLSLKDCTYRIYRDIRFSKNKLPYKTHMGAFIAPNGKKSGYSGYYFHIEADGANYLGGHCLCTGIYCPEQKILKSVREEIFLNGANFKSSLDIAKKFTLDRNDSLKKVPAGFPSDHEYADYFKLKNFVLTQHLDTNNILNEKLLENTIKEFKTTLTFNTLMNRAVEYGYENF